jgi:predicted NBD/HSP70 family sugar kinase
VTTLVRDLIEAGIVTPTEQSSPRTGRPAELIGLVGAAATAIGVKVADDHLAIVHADLDGTVLASSQTPFDAVGGNLFTTIAAHIEPLVAAVDGQSALLGIGIGLPGFEDPYGSGIVQAPLLGWRNLPLGEHLNRTLGLPVLVDNDVNTLAVAESLYGTGRGFENFVVVTLGRGVGMGIVVGGELYRGGRGAAGEFGHVTAGGSRLCSCGKRGCLETLISEPAMLEAARRRRVIAVGDGLEALLSKAAAKRRAAADLYAAAGAALGDALASAAVVLDPQAIVIAGEGTRGWPFMADAFAKQFAAGLFHSPSGVPVFVDEWDDTAWALGAAALVLRAPFATPLQEHPAIEEIRGRLDAGFQAPRAHVTASGSTR